jgi:hypothetical protein
MRVPEERHDAGRDRDLGDPHDAPHLPRSLGRQAGPCAGIGMSASARSGTRIVWKPSGDPEHAAQHVSSPHDDPAEILHEPR